MAQRFGAVGEGPRVTISVPPTMFRDNIRGFTTTLPDSNMCGHGNRIGEGVCAWFVMNKIINICIEKMSVVRMVVRRRSSKEVYAGRYGGIL